MILFLLTYFKFHGKLPLRPMPLFSQQATIKLSFLPNFWELILELLTVQSVMEY